MDDTISNKSVEDNTQEQEIPSSVADKIATVLLGFINNVFFLIVSSSAQRIVLHFNASGYLASVNWSSTICSLFASSINAWFSAQNISYDWRYLANSIFMAVGILGCAIAPNFWVACVSIIFVGFPCDFGESVSLGFFANIKKQSLVKYWSIGTGISGILGGGYSALCIGFEFDYKISFYCLLPLVFVYAFSYFCVLRTKKTISANDEKTPLLKSDLQSEETTLSVNEKISCCNFKLIKKIIRYIITCDTVYFCQYVIASAFIDCAQTEEIQKKYKFLFPLLSLVQHIGVLLFCSSISIFKCPYLEGMAFVQCLNFGIWLSQAMLHWMPLWAEFVFIFIVGSIGGLSYVNTYHMLLNDDRLQMKERELGANFTSFSVIIAVLLSSVFTLVAEKTFLKDFVPPPE